MNAPTTSGTGDLDAALAALPRALAPERDLWPSIEAALTPPAAAVSRRPWWPTALAAGVATAAIGSWLALHGARPAPPLAQTLAAPAALLATRAVTAKEDDLQATRAALARTYEERLQMLAPATRARVADDLASIRHAQDDLRRALEADPGSAVLMRLYQSTAQQEFDLYTTIGRNTEPVAKRTRT